MSDTINAQNCKIRNGEPRDAAALLEISNSVASEGAYFIAVAEEAEGSSLDQEREQIQKIMQNERETLIVAEIEGTVIGSIASIQTN